MLRGSLVSEPIPIQGVIQPVSTPITGEDTACPIPPMCRRSQSKHIESSLAISEAWNWPSPVGPITILLPFLPCNPLPISDQPGTGRAISDSLIQNGQGSHMGRQCSTDGTPILLAGDEVSC
jgi:hypothetical protein